jgi:hypothetical protein
MSNTDPLAAFRTPQPTARTAAPGSAVTVYEAFKTGNAATERLEIRRVLGDWHTPSYRYLMDVSYNGKFATELLLVYSFMIVKVSGKSMQPIIHAIQAGNCAFIQDYHSNEFASPQPGVPIITAIEIVKVEEKIKAPGSKP